MSEDNEDYYKAAPRCDKHFIPKEHTWWGGWVCPICEKEEAEVPE